MKKNFLKNYDVEVITAIIVAVLSTAFLFVWATGQ